MNLARAVGSANPRDATPRGQDVQRHDDRPARAPELASQRAGARRRGPAGLVALGLLGSLALVLAGCLPPASNQAEEEKEPFFKKGKELVNSLDFPGAAEAFDKALEVNPHNALAHYELGLLREKDDQAAAMYHFNKYIGLRPTSPQAERAKERILACRQELAQSAALTMTPGIQVMQRQLEFLTITNREMQRKLDEWQKWYANQGRFGAQTALLPVSPPATGRTAAPTNSRPVTADPTADPGRATSVGAPPRPPMPETKTHLVQPRDTMAAIARKHGVSVNALMSANPRVDARHMKTGQALYIPPR